MMQFITKLKLLAMAAETAATMRITILYMTCPKNPRTREPQAGQYTPVSVSISDPVSASCRSTALICLLTIFSLVNARGHWVMQFKSLVNDIFENKTQ